MSVTVSEILIAARAALAAVSSETAGYLVLGAADCLGDGKLGVANVYLDEGGALHVDRHGEPADIDAESGLRTLLKRLLETGRSPAPALLRLATTPERRGLPRLITEIEAALIPVNRAAARRALARLHRDVSRARCAPGFQSSLQGLNELAPSNAPPPVVAARAVPPQFVDPPVESAHRSTEGPTPVVPAALPEPAFAAAVEPAPVSAPSPLLTAEPDATPFLGTVAPRVLSPSAVHERRAAADAELAVPIDVAEDAEDEIDTDPAPPVGFETEGRVETPAQQGTTVVIGTYAAEPQPEAAADDAHAPSMSPLPADDVHAPSMSPLPADDVHAPSMSPLPAVDALYVAIPVVAIREGALPEAEVEVDLEDWDDAAPPSVVPAFTSMFDLVADTTAEPPRAAEDVPFDALPPLVFAIVERTGREPSPDSDAIAEELGIEVPATPMAAVSASDEEPQETSFGHLAEALIDEALAVEPRPMAPQPPVQALLRAPLLPHTETVPGLGFVNVAPVPPVSPPSSTPAPADDVAPLAGPETEGGVTAEASPEEGVAYPADEGQEEAAWDDEPFSDFESPTPSGVAVGGTSVASTYCPRRSDVAELVAAFVVAETRSLSELTRELKRIAGISATPAAPAVSEPRRKTSSAR